MNMNEKRGDAEWSSIADAERERLALVEKLQAIQVDLGDRNRINRTTGQRITDHEYWEWRRKATGAQRFVQGRLQRLNAWLKSQRTTLNAKLQARDLPDANDPIALLTAACNVIRGLARDGIELDAYEQGVCDLVREFLQHGPVAHAVADAGDGGK